MSEPVVVRAAVAPMHAEPRVSSPQISQRMAGHLVTVVAVDGDWLRVQGEDAYEGWMHRGYVELSAATDLTRGDRRLSLGCSVRRGAAAPVRSLPLGAWVGADDTIIAGETVDAAGREAKFPRVGSAIAETAVERFAGTPYQWGGVSPWGADCSGLVQTAYWLHGVPVPRDAWQQAEIGGDAGEDVSRWGPADLIFFSDRPDRRITHVGISLGDARLVHLALGRGGYAVESLMACDDAYVSALMSRFVVARRVL